MQRLEDWDIQLVEELAGRDENRSVEFKGWAIFSLNSKGRVSGNTKMEIAKQVCAFSNACDGFLVFGVDEQKKQLDDGIPGLVGTTPVKDWIEKVIPHLVKPTVLDCEALFLEKSGHHKNGRGVLVVKIPLSQRRPHWTSNGDLENPYIRVGAHSDLMKLQTFLDIKSRSDAPQAEIESIGSATVEKNNSDFAPRDPGREWSGTRRLQIKVKLLCGPVCKDWVLDLTTPQKWGRFRSRKPADQMEIQFHSKQHVTLSSGDQLFPNRSTSTSVILFDFSAQAKMADEIIEAKLYVGSSGPFCKRFCLNDICTES